MERIAAKLQTMLVVAKGRSNERGATAVEYGLLVALIAAVIITTVVTLGTQINSAFTSITSKL